MGGWDINKLKCVDFFRKTEAFSMYESFLQSQWFRSEKVNNLQWDRLRDLLIHAYDNVPYYYRIFNDMGIKPDQVNSFSDFRKIPVLTKDIIRARGKELYAKDAESFFPRKKSTGGSTGEPLRYIVDKRSHSALWAFIFRSWHTGGWNPGDKMVFLGGGTLFPSFSVLKRKFYAYFNNWLMLPSFDFTEKIMSSWIKKIRRFKARYMYSYASSAYLLANYIKQNKIHDIKFDAVFTTAEVLLPHYRKMIEEVYSCEVFDTYGGADGAGYAFECEEHCGLHIVTENAVVEIVKEDGSSAEEDESGNIITTDLFNYAMPFIRYKVEDVATFTMKKCPCGRGLPLLKNILGRTSDYILVKDGSKVHSSFFGYLFRDYDLIQQYLVIQENRNDVQIYIKPFSFFPNQQGQLQNLKQLVGRKLDGMNVEFFVTEEIPKTSNGKFKSVINKMRLL
jgi:phenylacetate-CoA ligase